PTTHFPLPTSHSPLPHSLSPTSQSVPKRLQAFPFVPKRPQITPFIPKRSQMAPKPLFKPVSINTRRFQEENHILRLATFLSQNRLLALSRSNDCAPSVFHPRFIHGAARHSCNLYYSLFHLPLPPNQHAPAKRRMHTAMRKPH